jgi:molecular chaperone GrpE
MTEGKNREPDSEDREELELDATDSSPLDAAIREAVAAVEEVEKKQVGKKAKGKPAAASGSVAIESEGPAETEGEFRRLAEARAEIERLRKEVASLKDTSLRTLADFDNYRRRSEREKEEGRRYALLDPMRDFVAVLDNLDRALAAEGRAEDLKAGVELIRRQMHVVLERNHVTAIAALGERFDPTVHEAVMQEENPDVEEPTVHEEYQRGYCLHDRLIRPAMVKVAMPAAKPSEDGDES